MMTFFVTKKESYIKEELHVHVYNVLLIVYYSIYFAACL